MTGLELIGSIKNGLDIFKALKSVWTFFRPLKEDKMPEHKNSAQPIFNVAGGSNIITNNQSGGTNIINPLPPRADNKLYQDGQPVAMIAGETVDHMLKTVTFTMWNTESLDYQRPVEFRNQVLRIVGANLEGRTLMGIAPNGQMGSNITPGVVCQIIGDR